jgi:glycosyltransferase involved in cell wall biosynthesis
MTKILWISPAFNHYKARFLNHLAGSEDISLTILAGSGRIGQGDEEIKDDWKFKFIRENVSKDNFGKVNRIRKRIKWLANEMDYILIPAEKKNTLLFIYLLWLRYKLKHFKLISYNHPILKSANGKIRIIDRWMTKFYYTKLDKVIFYTEESCKYAIEKGYVDPSKAYWANNTLDNTEIEKYYTYTPSPTDSFTFLFIGRLIPTKRIDVLLNYFSELKKILPNQSLKLEIIGDGPKSDLVKYAKEKDKDIQWHGSLVDEKEISPIMTRCNVVFIPGHSGLSINHAFMYGRPYLTIKSQSHGPEIFYIKENENGYFLSGDRKRDIAFLQELIRDRQKIIKWSDNAYITGRKLSVQNWVKKILNALKDE